MVKNIEIGCLYDKKSEDSYTAFQKLKLQYNLKEFNLQSIEGYQVIITLGGDGAMLKTLHITKNFKVPIFGMNRGSIGFLLNEYNSKNLVNRIKNSQDVILSPLKIHVTTNDHTIITKHAFNEVSLLRETNQIAKMIILIDDVIRMDALYSDGIIISTPAGSTAYNLAAHGPILPMSANILAMTPISPFRPRRWYGALLPHSSNIKLKILESNKRPVSLVADCHKIRDIQLVEIFLDFSIKKRILFDKKQNLSERIINEQFYKQE